jgi:hypothetical protein
MAISQRPSQPTLIRNESSDDGNSIDLSHSAERDEEIKNNNASHQRQQVPRA